MDKLAENDLTYFCHRYVVIVVTAVITISLPPVNKAGVRKVSEYNKYSTLQTVSDILVLDDMSKFYRIVK
jgi:hypothetical protein